MIIQHFVKGEEINAVAGVGNGPIRQTPLGASIDVKFLETGLWCDVVGSPEDLVALSKGDVVKIHGVVSQGGRRPLIFGAVTPLRKLDPDVTQQSFW